jgi:hypothetical protein
MYYVGGGTTNTNTNILLLMLFLVFLCMVALAVALCRVGRIERSVDTLVQTQSWRPQVLPFRPQSQTGAPWDYYYYQ